MAKWKLAKKAGLGIWQKSRLGKPTSQIFKKYSTIILKVHLANKQALLIDRLELLNSSSRNKIVVQQINV